MKTLTKIKLTMMLFLIIGIMLSLAAQDAARKRKSYQSNKNISAGSAGIADEIASGISGKKKRAHRMYDDGRRMGFHLKGRVGLNNPFLKLASYTNSGDDNDKVYEGDEECDKDGTISIQNFHVKNFKAVETDTSYMETYNMSGNVSFKNCKDGATDHFDADGAPDYYEEILNSTGTISISGKEGYGLKDITSISGEEFEAEVSDSNVRLIANKKSGFTYNRVPVQTMDITVKSNLQEHEGNPIKIGDNAYEVTRYLNGTVSVKGAINGKPVNESKTYKNKTFKYRFENCADDDDDYDDCDYTDSEE